MGSRILFTTRIKHVAIMRGADPYSHHLKFLDPDESWELLKKKVFRRGEICDRKVKKYARRIANECGGLPLAIAAVGDVLFDERKEYVRRKSNVNSILSEHPEKCKEILKSSYNDLPSHLSVCFLYFAAFPKGFEIPTKQLIRLWVAEGLVQDNPDQGSSCEEVAEDYLEKLIDSSLVEVVKRRSDGRAKTCKIHTLLWDIIGIYDTEHQNFVIHHYQRQLEQFTHDEQFIPRRLAGNSSILRYISSNCSSKLKTLRSILCFIHGGPPVNAQDIRTNLKSFCNNLLLLRVLHLEGIAPVHTLPNEMSKLFYLRYLSLGGTNLTKVPDSVFHLMDLQTLDVRSTSIRSISSGIWKLKKLRHLCLPEICLPSLPTATTEPSLVALQTLSTILPGNCTEEIFAQMPNLIKLGVCNVSLSNFNNLLKSIHKLQRLKSLKLRRDRTASPLQKLPSELPENLTKITLHNTGLALQQLGHLKHLQILKLVEQSDVEYTISFKSEHFKHLKVLVLKNINKRGLKLKMEKGALPRLKRLVIHNCHLLQKVPHEIEQRCEVEMS